MRFLLLLSFCLVTNNIWAAAQAVSESSLQLNSFEKRYHSIGIKYKKIDMLDANMYRGSVDSSAHITYATDSTAKIALNGVEFFYGYRWRNTAKWKTETVLNFSTSLDEPDLEDLERQYYSFEFYTQYMNVNVAQRLGREFSFHGKTLYLYGSIGVGYSVLKITELWKEQAGNTGDSTDLKSYARHFTQHYELGGQYRFSAQWAALLAVTYDHFKVDKLHTDFYGYSSGSKINGESDTEVDKDSSYGNFSSLSYGLSLSYFF